MHHQGVEVVGEAAGGGAVAGPFELADQLLEELLCLALVRRLVERLPVGPAGRLRSQASTRAGFA